MLSGSGGITGYVWVITEFLVLFINIEEITIEQTKNNTV
jgi:hypothetical protein